MERFLPIALAFALGVGAASLVDSSPTRWLTTEQAGSSDVSLIPPLDAPVRYPLPAYAAGLGSFRQ